MTLASRRRADRSPGAPGPAAGADPARRLVSGPRPPRVHRRRRGFAGARSEGGDGWLAVDDGDLLLGLTRTMPDNWRVAAADVDDLTDLLRTFSPGATERPLGVLRRTTNRARRFAGVSAAERSQR
jgi:hypothetical protein